MNRNGVIKPPSVVSDDNPRTEDAFTVSMSSWSAFGADAASRSGTSVGLPR
jgi:hypothetical protein